MMKVVGSLLRVYRKDAEHDRAQLLDQYDLIDFARKVVVSGASGRAAGSRCWSGATRATRSSCR
jgi:hypothetical protein